MAGIISIAGTQKTTSTSLFATNGFNSFISAVVSEGVLFIFQFPAIIFLLDIKLSNLLSIVCSCNTRKFLTLKEFK